MRLIPPGDAPAWMAAFARDVERAMRGQNDAPVRVPSFANVAALPNAAEWTNGVVRVASINALAFSDGSAWIRADTGATL